MSTGSFYGDAASFGRFRYTVGLYATFILGGVGIVQGYRMIRSKNVYSKTVKAIVHSAECDLVKEKYGQYYNCKTTVSYSVDNKSYTGTVDLQGPNKYTDGETVTIQYDPSDPNNIRAGGLTKHQEGWLLVGGAVLLSGMGWALYWLANRYKFFAAAGGVSGAFNLLGGFN